MRERESDEKKKKPKSPLMIRTKLSAEAAARLEKDLEEKINVPSQEG